MYPTNNYMDPYYSHFRDHCPYPYYPPPSFPAGNHPMTMDSSCPPPSYGPWPYSGSASHSSLPESHSCCNHTYPPGYYSFRPPFPKELTPPHPYYHGQFPHQPNAYPSYFVPPPPYAVDQTPYSYGKFKSHCCGCPNHVCLGEGKGNLKIEEEMPEVKPETEQKGPYNSSIIRHPNYQYPVMWLPSSNMNDKLIGSSSELPPQLFSKWFPPVCLRVDPLPTKKSGNRSSRSSNQATNKVCGKDMDVKEAPTKHKDTKISEPKKESNVSVKEKSTDEMNERIVSRDVTVQDASVKHGLEEQLSTIMAAQKVQPSVNAMAQENAGGNSLQAEIKIQGEAVKLGHEMNLSEVDAAICIQSAYRGYHVRRWQPLQKLRKIKSVHERMQDVKKQLQGLEASSKQQTAKEHIAINETIMNLLLNLDTIQGLHPSVKEARKSVARELTSLQEKLDSLCKQSSAETNQLKSEEEKYAGVEWSSTINSKESMHHDISYVVPMELRKDGDLTEQKHQMEESGTTREQAHDEGKALVPGECQGAPLMDVTSDVVFPGHLAEQKQHIEGANTILMEEWPEEEKAAAEDEGSSAHYIEPLHDSSVSEDSSVLKQLNDGVSPASTEDSTTAAAPTSMESEMVVDKDGSVESLVQEYASVDSSQLKHDVAPANEDQCNEPSTPFVNLEDSSLSSKDAESHGNDPGHADDSIVINQGDQPEEPRVAKMQKQVADPMISANEQDRTPEPTVGDTTVSVENSTQEQIISVEEASKQYEVCCKDETASVDQPNEHHTEKTAGDSDIGEELEAVPFFSKTENVENTLNVADSPNNMCAQPILPEGESSELPCEFDGPRVHEYSGSKVSLESPNDVQKQQSDGEASASEIVECNEMPKGAPVCAAVVNSAVPEADDPKEHPVCATGVNSAVLGTDDLKEDAGGPTISKDVAPVSTTHDGLKKNDEKNLIEENQMLKDMLQKLLASGSNQMGAMAELSEKVKVLEQKLARKKRPKVRVHRPSRNAAANVH